MTIGILGKKLGMTQYFLEDGTVVPVTVVQAGPCKVLQVKTATTEELPEEHRTSAGNRGNKQGRLERARGADGYYAIQLGFGPKSDKSATKPEIGHAKKADSGAHYLVREIRFDELPPYTQGDEVRVDIFKDVQRVDITGTSKGRGFAGTIKRHNFAGQSTTHGNSLSHRRVGGIGRQYSTHHGVPRGKKLPGHYGVDRTTIQNVEVMKVDEERNLLFLRGSVPGHRDSYIRIQKSVKV